MSIAFEQTPPPAPRPQDVTTTLADFAIVTFDVCPEALVERLPEGFAPDTFTLADGRRRAYVSAVPFRDLDFRFHAAPWARFAFSQTNYRAYVTYRGRRCVWFFGTTLDTPFVAVPRLAWKLPWHRARTRLEAVWEDERLVSYDLHTSGRWGAARLRLDGDGAPAGVLDGFEDEDACAFVLTHPLIGYMHRLDGEPTTYSVWHERLAMQRARPLEARFDVFEGLGLVARGQAPHSVLVQRQTEFIVRLPPRRLAAETDVATEAPPAS